MTDFRAGFVNIIGFPNVGKSTLLNKLVGENLAITSPKVQTTRQRILGIITTKHYQLIISDTPGILNPTYELQKVMQEEIAEAFEDADIFIYMVEAGDKPPKHQEWIGKIKNAGVPYFLVINKIDLTDEVTLKQKMKEWAEVTGEENILPLSALYINDMSAFVDKLAEKLPVHEAYFPEEYISDKTERFIAAEKIREQAFYIYKQEIPYSIEVEIRSFKEEENIIRISAEIYVSRESQKHIVIGKNGQALKELGTAARLQMEEFFKKKVFLEIHVKVLEDWQHKRNILRKLGYK